MSERSEYLISIEMSCMSILAEKKWLLRQKIGADQPKQKHVVNGCPHRTDIDSAAATACNVRHDV